jgi:tetratricopeptide (TPR) repeat protein
MGMGIFPSPLIEVRIMDSKVLNTLLVLAAAVVAPLLIVTASTVGAPLLPENKASATITRGVEHLEQGQWDLALEDFKQAVENDPQHPEAHYLLGFVNDELGHYDQAIDDYSRAIELGVESPFVAYAYRGLSYAKSGQLSPALADLDESIKIDPDFGEAYYFRGLIHSELGNTEQAISDLEQSLTLELLPEAKQHARAVVALLKEQ